VGEFGGRLVLRDGTGEADLFIDIDDEWITIMQDKQVLGRYSFREVRFLRWTESRFIMNFAGDTADFYPLRPDEFVTALDEFGAR